MASANVSARVAISKDGPYLVTGSPPLSRQTITTDSDGGSERWHEGETFAVQKNYALCRCGHSKTSHFATARTPRSDLMAPRRQVVNPTQSRRRLSMALWCHSRTQRAFVLSGVSATPTEVFGTSWHAPTNRPYERPSCNRQKIAPLAAWWRGTRRRESRWNTIRRSRLAWSKTRSDNVVVRSGFVAVLPSFLPVASSTKCATA
jgi:CDGSH-type Zn-finger protein